MDRTDQDKVTQYESPTVVRLGSLTELTQGGFDGGPDDGFGEAGDQGSFAG